MLHPFGTSIHLIFHSIRRIPIYDGNSLGLPSLTCLDAIPLCCATFMVFGSPADALGCVLSAIGGCSVVSEPLIRTMVVRY